MMKKLLLAILLAVILAGCKGGIVVETDHNAPARQEDAH